MYKYDLSMPVKDMYSLVEEARERFKAQGLDTDGSIKATVGYGHIGDGTSLSLWFRRAELTMAAGNLHINIVASRWDEKIEQAIEPWIYEATGTFLPLSPPSQLTHSIPAARNGSISAEHGLGLMKAPYLGYSKSDESIDVMRGIRDLFDPRGILSPYKYLPPRA